MNIIFLKKKALRLFFAAEIIVFAVFYFFGSFGIQRMMVLQAEQKELKQRIASTQKEIEQLDIQLVQWKNRPFSKEKIAREQLQMAREGDEVYYVS